MNISDRDIWSGTTFISQPGSLGRTASSLGWESLQVSTSPKVSYMNQTNRNDIKSKKSHLWYPSQKQFSRWGKTKYGTIWICWCKYKAFAPRSWASAYDAAGWLSQDEKMWKASVPNNCFFQTWKSTLTCPKQWLQVWGESQNENFIEPRFW